MMHLKKMTHRNTSGMVMVRLFEEMRAEDEEIQTPEGETDPARMVLVGPS